LAIQWVLLRKVFDLLFGWRNWFGKYSLDIWNLVTLCLMWTLWRECNHCMFEDTESSKTQLIVSLTSSLFDWSCVWSFTNSNSIVEFIVASLCIILFLCNYSDSFVFILLVHEVVSIQ
jgi:hypothetical protein